jgi:hypothetical protein
LNILNRLFIKQINSTGMQGILDNHYIHIIGSTLAVYRNFNPYFWEKGAGSAFGS